MLKYTNERKLHGANNKLTTKSLITLQKQNFYAQSPIVLYKYLHNLMNIIYIVMIKSKVCRFKLTL